MAKILNFGSCNLDYVYSLDHIVTVGETEASIGLQIFPGGKGLNQSIAVARAGAKVYHAGAIGEDGMLLQSILRGSGVDVSFLRVSEGRSGHAIIQVAENGENSIVLHQGANVSFTKEQIDCFLEGFGVGDVMLVQNETNLVDYAVDKAYEKGMTVVLTPSPFNENIKKIDISKLSYLLLNEIEIKELSGVQDTEAAVIALLNKYPNLRIMLTLGSKGCIYRDVQQSLFHPAFSVKAVDTTGAGDTFAGYFITGISEGMSSASAMRLASAAAALAVSKKGAATSIPMRNAVEEALSTLRISDRDTKLDVITEKVCSYIELRYADATLKELSAELGYSEVYAGEVVKRVLGTTFTSAIKKKRCEVARTLLSDTDLPISDIICEVGYENESYFRKSFKTLYGKTPGEYRRLVKGLKYLVKKGDNTDAGRKKDLR